MNFLQNVNLAVLSVMFMKKQWIILKKSLESIDTIFTHEVSKCNWFFAFIESMSHFCNI